MHLRIILVFEVERYTDVTYLGSGVTVSIRFRYNKKKNYYARFLFIYLNTIVQITFFFYQDVKILHIRYYSISIVSAVWYMYKICFVLIVSVHK